MKILLRCCLLVLVLVLGCAALAARAAPLTIAQAIDPNGALSASLSPDGKHVAIVFFNGLAYQLQVYDTSSGTSKVLASSRRSAYNYTVKSPRKVAWAGNELLAVDYGYVAESMDLNGKKVAELGVSVIGKGMRDQPESAWLLVYTDRDEEDMALANARTGEIREFSHPPGKVMHWALDRHGALRAVTLVNSAFWRDVSTVSNWYRASENDEWQKLAEFGIAEDYWVPVYVPDAPHTLAISSRIGRDTYAMFSYDTGQRVIGEMMAGHPREDILGVTGIDQAAFERVRTRGMRVQDVWFDPVWASVQETVDTLLSGRVNVLSGDPRGMVLVYSYSDVEPGAWHLLDMARGSMRELLQSHLAVRQAAMRPMEVLRYPVSDGLTVPAFLTRPADTARNVPLVVLIHGGPTARDYWGWDEEVQLLAARGYAVFQPQFRGSAGFGKRFQQAGYGQWGQAMQDDITAGVRLLIEQGIADPARICIVGASYGGYAALWGLVKTPELYRCGVSFAGVSDIEYMFSDSSDRVGDKVTRQMMLSRIGDVRANHEKFAQVSPLKQAGRINVPVLLMHGDEDERVPISHGKKMKQALEANGKQVEWLVFEREGHGLYYLENEKKYYEAMLNFLDKYIGAPAP